MPFRDYILDRFWLKLFSFILATLIWFTVQSNVQMESRFSANPFRTVELRDYSRMVHLDTLPTNRKLYKVDPLTVTITVRGNTALLDKVRQYQIQPYVTLTDAPDNPGEFIIEVRNLPPNMRVERVIPPRVL